ncbi:MAG: hypothetical protein NDJ90_14240, partial [Oligoflexia bacterium]|nr:hypothetical protein [Oligoflexia bacterium]
RLNLSRMRGLIWLVGYPRYEGMLSVDEYADEVLRGRIREPSLSFRLERGFKVVGTIDGHWAVLDWPNPRELEFTRGLS